MTREKVHFLFPTRSQISVTAGSSLRLSLPTLSSRCLWKAFFLIIFSYHRFRRCGIKNVWHCYHWVCSKGWFCFMSWNMNVRFMKRKHSVRKWIKLKHSEKKIRFLASDRSRKVLFYFTFSNAMGKIRCCRHYAYLFSLCRIGVYERPSSSLFIIFPYHHFRRCEIKMSGIVIIGSVREKFYFTFPQKQMIIKISTRSTLHLFVFTDSDVVYKRRFSSLFCFITASADVD